MGHKANTGVILFLMIFLSILSLSFSGNVLAVNDSMTSMMNDSSAECSDEIPCLLGFECTDTGECIKSTEVCDDGTLSGLCSETIPLFCYNGQLKPMCNECGCPDGYDCLEIDKKNEIPYKCVKSQLKCDDGTLNGSCSNVTKPLFCDEGRFTEKCDLCGCDTGQCQSDGSCFENSGPVMEEIGNKEIAEGETLEFTLSATDPDNDEIKFYASNIPPGSVFDSKDGTFTWTPTYEQTGIYWVTFAVTDMREYPLSASEVVRITVGDVNRPPETDEINYISVNEGEMIEIIINATDPDGDVLTYSADNLPEGSKFDSERGRFTWVPDYGKSGNYELIFTTSDGEFESPINVVITVGNLNRPPKAVISHPAGGQEFETNEYILLSASGSYDPDNEHLEYSWDFGDGNTKITDDVSISHMYSEPGEYLLVLYVSDDEGLYDKSEIKIKLTEGKTGDSDGDGVFDNNDECPDTPPFSQVNMYGCTLPKYTSFESNETTDFSKVDLKKAQDVVIEKQNIGKIEFRKNQLDLVNKNLDKYVSIKENEIKVDSELAPDLNKSAVIVFYNVKMENPVILKDGFYCDECKAISYEDNKFSFYVPHFTTYSLLTMASYSGYCGDNLCSIYETCSDCSEDCGKCRDGRTKKIGTCEEMWVCSGWSECNELDIRTRECMDVNFCGMETKKPYETMSCNAANDPFSFITFALFLVVLVMVFLVSEAYKSKKENKKMDKFELESFVKGHIYRGFSKDEIKRTLLEKGYDEKDIDKTIKTLEDEIF